MRSRKTARVLVLDICPDSSVSGSLTGGVCTRTCRSGRTGQGGAERQHEVSCQIKEGTQAARGCASRHAQQSQARTQVSGAFPAHRPCAQGQGDHRDQASAQPIHSLAAVNTATAMLLHEASYICSPQTMCTRTGRATVTAALPCGRHYVFALVRG